MPSWSATPRVRFARSASESPPAAPRLVEEVASRAASAAAGRAGGRFRHGLPAVGPEDPRGVLRRARPSCAAATAAPRRSRSHRRAPPAPIRVAFNAPPPPRDSPSRPISACPGVRLTPALLANPGPAALRPLCSALFCEVPLAHHKSAEKRARQSLKRAARNRSVLRRTRTVVKSLREAIASGDADQGRRAAPPGRARAPQGGEQGHRPQAPRRPQRLAPLQGRREARPGVEPAAPPFGA